MFLKAISMLDLTDEQQQEIQTIRFLYAKDMVRKRADIDVASISAGNSGGGPG